jgi:hypothetical protein
VPWNRLRLLDLETGELRVVDGLRGRHVVELAQRPDGGPPGWIPRSTGSTPARCDSGGWPPWTGGHPTGSTCSGVPAHGSTGGSATQHRIRT